MRHVSIVHDKLGVKCDEYDKLFSSKDAISHYTRDVHSGAAKAVAPDLNKQDVIATPQPSTSRMAANTNKAAKARAAEKFCSSCNISVPIPQGAIQIKSVMGTMVIITLSTCIEEAVDNKL